MQLNKTKKQNKMESKNAIGFGTQFFTLWNLSTEFQYSQTPSGQYVCTGYFTRYSYLGKLSKDLEKAKSKCEERGIKISVVDENLRGSRSWTSRPEKNFCEIPKSECSVFQFGKYDNQKISECIDFNYLSWYYSETKNKFAQEVLIASGQFELFVWEHDGEVELMTTERAFQIRERLQKQSQSIVVADEIRRTGFAEFIATKNLSSNGCIRAEINGGNVNFYFPEFRVLFYNGYEYALPVLNGTGKKIKGKTIRVNVISDGFNEREEEQFKVTSFEVI